MNDMTDLYDDSRICMNDMTDLYDDSRICMRVHDLYECWFYGVKPDVLNTLEKRGVTLGIP